MNETDQFQSSQNKNGLLVLIYIALLAVPLAMMQYSKNVSPAAPQAATASTETATATADETRAQTEEPLAKNQETNSATTQEAATNEETGTEMEKENVAAAEPPLQESIDEETAAKEEKAAEPEMKDVVLTFENETVTAPTIKEDIKIETESPRAEYSSVPFGVSELEEISSPEGSGSLKICRMKEWDVQFKCDLTWEILDKEKENFRLVLSKDPMVTVSWQKFDKKLHFFNQMNRMFFEAFNLYQDGFQMENVKFSDHDAILVKGFSKQEPAVEMRDYYYLYGDKLLGVFFRLEPGNKSDNGKLIMKQVKDTFAKL